MSSQVMGAMAALKAAYPRQQIEQSTIRVYAEMLADADADALTRAIKRIIATSKFFPTIAEIRQELAREELCDRPAPELAWQEVVEELRRVGHSRAPEFSCPEIYKAVRAVGGWEYLCLAERNPYDRSRFVDAYRAALERTQLHTQLGPGLAGDLDPAAKKLIGQLTKQLTPGEEAE